MRQKNTKWSLALSGILIATLFALVGCSKKEEGTAQRGEGISLYPTNGLTSQGVLNGGVGTSAGFNLYGIVYSNNMQQAIQNFMYPTTSPSGIGTIASQPDGRTGVIFGGDISLSNGQGVNRIGYSNVQITPASKLLIGIYDSYSIGAEPIVVYFTQGSGFVSGNSAQITFGDEIGEVTLNGSLGSQYFEGTMTYDNYATVFADGHQVAADHGTIGQFRIPKCKIFKCN